MDHRATHRLSGLWLDWFTTKTAAAAAILLLLLLVILAQTCLVRVAPLNTQSPPSLRVLFHKEQTRNLTNLKLRLGPVHLRHPLPKSSLYHSVRVLPRRAGRKRAGKVAQFQE